MQNRPSAWRLSTVPLLVMGGVLVVLMVVFAIVEDPHMAWIPAAAILPMFLTAQVGAARVLTAVLDRFARVVESAGGGDPQVQADRQGTAALVWPTWRIGVAGEVARFHVRRFGFTAGGHDLAARITRASASGTAALHLAGRGPGVVGAWDGSLPLTTGIGPFLWLPVVGGCFGVPVALLLPDWIGIAVGVLAALLTVASLVLSHAKNRPAARAFLEGIRDAGVRVDPPIVVWHGHAPHLVVPTSRGAFVLSWMSWFGADRLYVDGGHGEARVPRAGAYAAGRRWATGAPP